MAYEAKLVEPKELSEYPGFHEQVVKLAAAHELDELRGARPTYSVAEYQRLYDAGVLNIFRVTRDEELRAWGVVIKVKLPRRNAPMWMVDAFWSEDRSAGTRLLYALRSMARAVDATLMFTAPAESKLYEQLSKHADYTHGVFALRP